MAHIWRIINIGLVIFSFYFGYAIMAPAMLGHNNPDAILCVIVLVLIPLFALGSVYYSIYRWKCSTLRRPSWNRFPANWWFDPLQSLFMSTWAMAAVTLGSALRLPAVGFSGFWMSASLCCITIGLLVGQFFVYKIFRSRIVDAP